MENAPVWTVGTRRAPEPGESLSGFMARVAAAEGLPNTLELTSIGGATWSRRPELSRGAPDFSGLESCLRLDAGELDAMAYPVDPLRPGRRLYGGLSIDKRNIVHDERRFSPTTLARLGYHRAEWQLRPFPFCRESWEFLGSRCPDPDCGARQGWYHASGVDLCDQCGEPLERARQGTVAPEHRPALEAALDLLHPDPARRRRGGKPLPADLSDTATGDLLDLLVAVAGVHDPDIRCRSDRLSIRTKADPVALTTAMAHAWRTLTSWPDGFQTLAADRISTRVGRAGDGNRGATMRLLQVATERGASPVLADLVRDLRRSIAATVSTRAVDCRTAARLPHLKVTTLTALRRRGVLSTVFAISGNEPQPYLDRREVEALSGALRSSLPLNHAAKALGISDHGVEQLETLGLLAFEGAPGTIPVDGSHRVNASSLERLTTALTASAVEPSSDWIGLPTVMRSIGGRLKPWGPIMKTMVEGRVKHAIGPGRRSIMRRVLVDPADATTLIRSVYVPPAGAAFLETMSKGDALEVLNQHPRHGAEALKRWPSATSSDRTVPVSDILAMSRRLVSLGELVARTGRSAQTVVVTLTKNGVPTDGPWTSRDEAEAALFGLGQR